MRVFFLLAAALTALGQTAWNEQGIVHTRLSPQAKLHSLPVSAVQLGEGFWEQRRETNRKVSIPTLYQELEGHGILDNFRRLSGAKQVARRGPLYTDSDLYKWMEAVAFEIHSGHREHEALLKRVISEVLAAQEPSGYLNTYYTGERADQRHTNMAHGHELYCLGHLLQAGVAYYRATGERTLLDCGIRFVRYLQANFGEKGKPLFEGHPEIEMALVEAYRTTGDKSLLKFAGYLLESDPRLRLRQSDLIYLFTGKPFTERTQFEGHAVRAQYAASGATDYFLETGARTYADTLDRLWDDLVNRKMYITGGTGSRASGEAFGEPYELPNELAYTESCAAIANMMWNWRMLQRTGDAKYADVIERALYNGVNSGLSLDGKLYCYRNPLELVGSQSDTIRNPWYDTTCCPPNLQRVLASLPGYFYSTASTGVFVHLFHSGTMRGKLENGTKITIEQETKYPWEGLVRLKVSPETEQEFTLFVRVPAWSERTGLTVNGESVGTIPAAGSYAPIRRKWKPGDMVELSLDMQVRHTKANARVRDNVGKVAVERGPLVYCLEGVDQPAAAAVERVALKAGAKSRWEPSLLGGVVSIEHEASAAAGDDTRLYAPATVEKRADVTVKLVPYYAFANRGTTRMIVWIPSAN